MRQEQTEHSSPQPSQVRSHLLVIEMDPHALTSMARLKPAQGDLGAAIKIYESLVSKRADPIDNAALGDLYQLAGRPLDASRQFQQVDIESQRDLLSSALYNRHLVLFWTDHDRNSEQAYEKARKEFDVRRDVYGADALAWAAFKAGKLKEAQTSSAAALRLGTRDARLFYHAGMIARAAGDLLTARKYLNRALQLNPHFDPVHALVAQKALAE
jgi:tetratricopeptide (TPR) repeat protein